MWEHLSESLFGTTQAVPVVGTGGWHWEPLPEVPNLISGFNLKRLLQEKITPHTRGLTCPDGAMTMPERKAEKFPRPTTKPDLL